MEKTKEKEKTILHNRYRSTAETHAHTHSLCHLLLSPQIEPLSLLLKKKETLPFSPNKDTQIEEKHIWFDRLRNETSMGQTIAAELIFSFEKKKKEKKKEIDDYFKAYPRCSV